MHFQASCGLAIFPEHAVDTDSPLAAADQALFSIMEIGGGCGQMFDVGDLETVDKSRQQS
jgi:predicted signal transduction protein with EAL and GGDEF domain